jgi:hypothetical protein
MTSGSTVERTGEAYLPPRPRVIRDRGNRRGWPGAVIATWARSVSTASRIRRRVERSLLFLARRRGLTRSSTARNSRERACSRS